jgi:hypothetical protein
MLFLVHLKFAVDCFSEVRREFEMHTVIQGYWVTVEAIKRLF